MSDTIIRVENLAKKYILGHKQESNKTFREAMTNAGQSIVSALNPRAKKEAERSRDEFWALKDVSFEIKQGDRVGIIGRNGAGKSTLLKVLSRITEPTSGSIRIKGRIASLLEVGTGFHPELTGRENVFLNGAILGMSKVEIERKFDEIVAFAEIEKFLDTPVKRYSSGMYVRLAFAVAAHLEPEILIVDEVLAVGDVQFQKKCLGKMEDVSKEGRTVLFVSHNMSATKKLCSTGIILEKGYVKKVSQDVDSLIKDYLFEESSQSGSSEWVNSNNEFSNPYFKPLRFFISDQNGTKQEMPLENDSEIWVQIEVEMAKIDVAFTIGYAIYTEDRTMLYWSYQTDVSEDKCLKLHTGRCILKSKIPQRFLNEGVYQIELIASIHQRLWLLQPEVNAPSIFLNIKGGLSDSAYWMVRRPGLLAPVINWQME